MMMLSSMCIYVFHVLVAGIYLCNESGLINHIGFTCCRAYFCLLCTKMIFKLDRQLGGYQRQVHVPPKEYQRLRDRMRDQLPAGLIVKAITAA